MLPGRPVAVGSIPMWYLGLGCGVKRGLRGCTSRREDGFRPGVAGEFPSYWLAYYPPSAPGDLGLVNLASMAACVGTRPGSSEMDKRVRRRG